MIYTIGYEGANLMDFVASLKAAGVDTLIDVREVAMSRRKGFAKTALSNALAAEGVEYIHLKGLGDPKPGREAARSGDWGLFRKIFSSHMETDAAQQHLDTAMNIVSGTVACLMCFEREPLNCHRSIVADRLSETSGKKVRHIDVQKGISEQWVAAE